MVSISTAVVQYAETFKVLAAVGTIGGGLFGFDIRFVNPTRSLGNVANLITQFNERVDRHRSISELLQLSWIYSPRRSKSS